MQRHDRRSRRHQAPWTVRAVQIEFYVAAAVAAVALLVAAALAALLSVLAAVAAGPRGSDILVIGVGLPLLAIGLYACAGLAWLGHELGLLRLWA